jgi:hypothetical protein
MILVENSHFQLFLSESRCVSRVVGLFRGVVKVLGGGWGEIGLFGGEWGDWGWC